MTHFHVEGGPDGQLPAEQAAALLAMHCLVRGQSPSDYVVMVEAQEDLLDGIKDKAEKLLCAGRSVPSPVQLSRREEEVLGGILRSLANKEIAAALHLSERTVKFHVSSLLAKFQVRGRMELLREASRACLAPRPALSAEPLALPAGNHEEHRYPAPPAGHPLTNRSAAVLPLRRQQLMA